MQWDATGVNIELVSKIVRILQLFSISSSTELPASVVQEPTTPTTPYTNKSSSEPPTFPISPSLSEPTSVKNEPDDTIDSCLSSFLNSDSSGQQETSSFDLDLELELEGLESMDLSNMTNDVRQAPAFGTDSSLAPSMQSNLDLMPTVSPGGMDVDMEWLDSIISPPSTPSTSVAPAQTMPSNQQNITLHAYNNNNENNHDPMLSMTSPLHNPLDLFSLNDMDFKASAELSTALSWDRLDFAA